MSTEAKCPVHHSTNSGPSNRDWWPNQLPLDLLRSMFEVIRQAMSLPGLPPTPPVPSLPADPPEVAVTTMPLPELPAELEPDTPAFERIHRGRAPGSVERLA